MESQVLEREQLLEKAEAENIAKTRQLEIEFEQKIKNIEKETRIQAAELEKQKSQYEEELKKTKVGAFSISKKVNSGLGNTQRQTSKAYNANKYNNI